MRIASVSVDKLERMITPQDPVSKTVARIPTRNPTRKLQRKLKIRRGHLESIEVGYSDMEYICIISIHFLYLVSSYYHDMSRLCLTYSFLVVASLYLEYSRYILGIFFPGHWVIWQSLPPSPFDTKSAGSAPVEAE
jgi:hypothetical protein